MMAAAALIGAISVPLAAAGGDGGVRRFAVVVGENEALRQETAPLRYADDDAVATHRLLLQAGVDALLLVDLDADSRRLHRGVAPFGPPTRERLRAAVERTRERIEAARAQGQPTELLFVYSGHGDVEHGEGQVALADGRLTRSELYRDILERAAADRNHVIVDACKSYFLAFEKGAGGERAPFPAGFASPASRLSAATGFVLSTSSDRDSHEWERFQAGVFSHQVRSALRGSADVDGDGHISYSELGAFLQVANLGIENPRFRPDFVVRPPRDDSAPLLAWPGAGETLELDGRGWGHLYLENGVGERLLDVHPRQGASFLLRLPAERPLFVRRQDLAEEWAVVEAGSAQLAALSATPPSVSRRGAEHLAFERLFAAPFGRADVEAYRARVAAPARPAPGAEREAQPAPGVDLRVVGGWSALGVGALAALVGMGSNLYAYERQQSGQGLPQQDRSERNALISTLNGVAIGAYATAGVAGAGGLALLIWSLTDDTR